MWLHIRCLMAPVRVPVLVPVPVPVPPRARAFAMAMWHIHAMPMWPVPVLVAPGGPPNRWSQVGRYLYLLPNERPRRQLRLQLPQNARGWSAQELALPKGKANKGSTATQ